MENIFLRFLSGAALLTLAASANAQMAINGNVPASIIDGVKSLRIESISLSDKILTVVYTDEKINGMMATSVADAVCEARFNGTPKLSKDTLNKIVVTNHWKMQGFSFAIDASVCDEYGKTSGEESNSFIKNLMTTYP